MLMEGKKANEILIVKVCEKRLDSHNSEQFKGCVAEYIDQGEKVLALDLSHVEFIDSSGLGAIVSCLKAVGTEGELSIFGLQGATLSMFKLTRMDKVFRIFSTEEEALAA